MATSVEGRNHHATATGAHHPDPPGLAVSSDTIKEHFDRLDTDHDGAITCDEFIQAFSQLFPGTTEEQARFFFRSIDLDRNGHIDFDEFTRFVDRQTHCGHGEGIGLEMKADSVRAIFNAFDADGNGTLDKPEVLNALRMWDQSVKITPEDINVMWPSFDTNRDGVIDFEEFSNLVLRQLRQDQASSMLYSD